MSKLAIVFVALIAMAYAIDHSPVDLRDEFRRFQQTYQKVYASEDFSHRFAVFSANFQKAKMLNAAHVANGGDSVYGVSPFMDLSETEFRSMYLNNREIAPRDDKPITIYGEGAQDVPSSYDWRQHGAVTAVKNQGQCGSCWAFSTTEETESVWFLTTGKLPILGPQMIVDCDTEQNDPNNKYGPAYGCDGGWTESGFDFVQSFGLETEADYPYQAVDGTCNIDNSKLAIPVNAVTGYNYASKAGAVNETNMLHAVWKTAPLSICADASTWQYYTGGVLSSNCGQQLDHCIQITGFQTIQGQDAWNVRNSWGTSWGEQGYLWVARGNNVCGVGNDAIIPTMQSS